MEELLRLLEIERYLLFEELNGAYICNLNEDKILIIIRIEQLDEINKLVNHIPSVRNKIIHEINNEKNLEYVEGNKIPMAKFLWDLYIIALHNVIKPESKFPSEVLSRYERDRFIARKIIIQYEHEQELIDEFRRVVFPHKELDRISLLDTYENEPDINYEKLDEFLNNVNILVDKEA
ncbi:hypothetical protein [Paenibacillus sp. PL2-23]|uniref:hypothetical protein n=1 Tax=Paenibacillus sp. PL2-23 TaxID=2100729 RepID=UPI0030F60D4F